MPPAERARWVEAHEQVVRAMAKRKTARAGSYL